MFGLLFSSAPSALTKVFQKDTPGCPHQTFCSTPPPLLHFQFLRLRGRSNGSGHARSVVSWTFTVHKTHTYSNYVFYMQHILQCCVQLSIYLGIVHIPVQPVHLYTGIRHLLYCVKATFSLRCTYGRWTKRSEVGAREITEIRMDKNQFSPKEAGSPLKSTGTIRLNNDQISCGNMLHNVPCSRTTYHSTRRQNTCKIWSNPDRKICRTETIIWSNYRSE